MKIFLLSFGNDIYTGHESYLIARILVLRGADMDDVKYSSYDLLGYEKRSLEQKEEPPRFWTILGRDIFKQKMFTFEFLIPNDLYLRAEVLCEDVNRMAETKKELTQPILIEYIFSEFLYEVRKNVHNTNYLYSRIKKRQEQLPLEENNPIIPTKSKSKVASKIHREDVLRSEVFLRDIAEHDPNHKLTVEKLINIVYQDFIIEYKQGRRKDVFEELVDYMEDY